MNKEEMLNKVICGDCLIKLKDLEDNSIDSIVTDPPYELGFMGKSWDNTGIANNKEMWAECLRVLKPGGHLLAFSGTRTYHRMACAIEDAGFDIRDQIAWCYGQGFPKSLNVFKQLKKKCKCGNMEVYENRIKQMGKDSEKETEYFLRFMQEADLSQTIGSEKERGEVLQSGLSEQSSHRTMQGEEPNESSQGREERILEGGNNTKKTEGELQRSNLSEMPEGVYSDGEKGRIHNATQVSDGSTPEKIIDENGSGASHRPQSEQQQYREPCAFCKQWGAQAIRTHGVGTALKPSIEPICMARKPLDRWWKIKDDGKKIMGRVMTVAENCLKWGTGGINIDESRVGTEEITTQGGDKFKGDGIYNKYATCKETTHTGRFPANLIHDNSEEVRECFPETKGGGSQRGSRKWKGEEGDGGFGGWAGKVSTDHYVSRDDGTGNASRFFKSILYYPKASKSERNKGCEELPIKSAGGLQGRADGSLGGEPVTAHNNHPTVKPIALMEYLIKMVTPKGGIVLDPFAGSGSTLVAAKQNGFQYIGIELTEEYIPIIEARLNSLTQDKLL